MRADRPCHAKVFWHPVGQDDTPWLAGHNLAWLAGAPFEDTAAALRLILAGVTDRYPRIRFIVPHLGGTIPFLLARVTRKSTAEITGGLRGMYYDTVSGSPDALTSACRAFGTDRLLFGTGGLSRVRHRTHPLDRLVVRHLAANRARRPLGAGEGWL